VAVLVCIAAHPTSVERLEAVLRFRGPAQNRAHALRADDLAAPDQLDSAQRFEPARQGYPRSPTLGRRRAPQIQRPADDAEADQAQGLWGTISNSLVVVDTRAAWVRRLDLDHRPVLEALSRRVRDKQYIPWAYPWGSSKTQMGKRIRTLDRERGTPHRANPVRPDNQRGARANYDDPASLRGRDAAGGRS